MRVIMGMIFAGLIYTALPGTWQNWVVAWFEKVWAAIGVMV